MSVQLFHFSEDPTIKRFVPRPVKKLAVRPKGMNWLNGPLVWAIDADHSPLYFFPRDCPRIVMSKGDLATEEDVARYWTDPSRRKVAFVEEEWVDRIATASVFRYEFDGNTFTDLYDAGMHVTDTPVLPKKMTEMSDLFVALKTADVEVRTLRDLSGLKDAWGSSLQVSGIRLRNAKNWT